MNQHDSPVRVGVIGLGAIGQRLLGAFHRHPAFQVSAVHDVDDARTREAAQQYAARAHDGYRSLLSDDRVDLVYIAVPPAAHHEITLAALAARKHVLCEKPLALNTAQGQEMLDAARATGVIHAMQLPMYHSRGVQVLVDQLESGVLGTVRRADLTLVFPEWPRAWQMNDWIGRREQGGPIREVTPHLFQVVERALGRVQRLRADVVYPADGVSSEESALGVLELQGGLRVNVSLLCHVSRPETVDFTVYGSDGTLGLTRWDQPVFSADASPPALLPVPGVDRPASLLDHLSAAIRGEPADLPGFDVGLRLQRLQDAWEDAANTGGWVDCR